MRIDFAQLAAFAAVINEGTFELAARRLHVTPSAISQRIKVLEERLGQVLVQRASPCRATAAGRILLRLAERVEMLEAEALAALGGGAETPAAAIRVPVVVNADSLDSWFADVFGPLSAQGEVVLDIRVEDQDHSERLLREGTAMAGVSTSAKPIQGCRVVPLGVMRYLAVATPDFVTRHFSSGISAEALASAPMLRFNRKDALQDRFIAHWSGAALRPPTHFVPSTASFHAAVRRGLGWGMHPEQFVAAEVARGELVELAREHCIEVPLYWHCWRIPSAALERLGERVNAAARQHLRPLPAARA